MAKRILMVTGEASGDLHGAYLVKSLRVLDSQLIVLGIGGEKMRAVGVKILFDIKKLGVVGLFEVFPHLGVILRAYRMLKNFLKRGEVDLLILIDYPDFNLRLAGVAKRLGIPIVYYISPQIWAWRKGRIKSIKRLVDEMMVILPFEKRIYDEAGIPCTFVGHPLLDEIPVGFEREAFCSRHGLDPSLPILGILPGSRQSEVNSHMPVLMESLTQIKENIPDLQIVLAIAPSLPQDLFNSWVPAKAIKIHRVFGETTEVLKASTGVITASGTSTLQAAICGVPMVIIYRVSPLTYFLGRLLIKVNFIGLVNVIAGRKVVPEFIQGEVTPERIAVSITPFFLDPDLREKIQGDLSLVSKSLGEPGASMRAAEVVYAYLQSKRDSTA